ncbi:MAG TPA: TIGR01777 family oxidoreductase [Acidimicrobiales bacterium]|nr:TIGR01777 family oxidoreductase [Acidimicrobiales bacterium]
MKVAITGSSGLIGTALTKSLLADGHSVVRMLRNTKGSDGSPLHWDPARGELDPKGLEGVDAVVHLAGAGILDKRWTDARKKELLDSRVLSTSLLADTLASMGSPPPAFLSGSAIGWYGERVNQVCTEISQPGEDFLAGLCSAWEAATEPAKTAGIRVVHLRTGLVQSTEGGMLAKTLPLYKLGLGGRLGSGGQWWSWISIADEIGAIRFLLEGEVGGPVNLTAPEPVTNLEYTRTLGAVLGRPTLIPTPMLGPRLLLGSEAAQTLVESQRVIPRVLEDAGYQFAYPTLDPALRALLG